MSEEELTERDRQDLKRVMRKLGSKGGKVGGVSRWAGLSDEERSAQMSAIASRPRPGAKKAAKKAGGKKAGAKKAAKKK